MLCAQIGTALVCFKLCKFLCDTGWDLVWDFTGSRPAIPDLRAARLSFWKIPLRDAWFSMFPKSSGYPEGYNGGKLIMNLLILLFKGISTFIKQSKTKLGFERYCWSYKKCQNFHINSRHGLLPNVFIYTKRKVLATNR